MIIRLLGPRLSPPLVIANQGTPGPRCRGRRVCTDTAIFIILYDPLRVKDRNYLDSNNFISVFGLLGHDLITNKPVAIAGYIC